MTCNCAGPDYYFLTGHADWCSASPIYRGWCWIQIQKLTGYMHSEYHSSSANEQAALTAHFAGLDWAQPPDVLLIHLARRVAALPNYGSIHQNYPQALREKITGKRELHFTISEYAHHDATSHAAP